MATKDWKKGKYDSWVRKDGVPITNYGRTQLYPFIQIGKNYSTKTGTYERKGWKQVSIIGKYSYGNPSPYRYEIEAWGGYKEKEKR